MRNQDSQNRPSPEALLEEVRNENRGRLKIFLGAAPGVGKTFAMLRSAHSRLEDGLDVVSGIVETHGRQETEAVLGGLEVMPRQLITYRGIDLEELDIDAVLARKPQLALIDELAHTNIPGSRHPKRFQDVEELLAAGIDVYSTLNIQHVESLNDVVARISNVQIRETVPDRILEMADEIELIDLPPKELQKRLKEGKVYVPEQAKRAENHFFSQGNLTALRELALRYTAERVDRQMLTYMRARGIDETWPTRDRLMVCIDNSPSALELVRTCSRVAERQKVPWLAVYVDNILNLSKNKDYISQAMHLVDELGGETFTLSGDNIVKEIMEVARLRHVTRIIVGKPKAKWWRIFSPSVAQQLFKQGETFELLIIPTEDIVVLERQMDKKPTRPRTRLMHYIIATLSTIVAGLAAFGVYNFLPLPNLSLIFLASTLYVALRSGFWPAVYTIILSFITYNSFFTESPFTESLTQHEHILSVTLFLLVATITSRLASQIRNQVDVVKQNSELTAKLYEFSKKIAGARDLHSVLHAIVQFVGATLGEKTIIMLPKEYRLEIVAGYSDIDELSRGAAEWAWRHGEPAGRFCSTLPASPWIFIPMKTESTHIGILGVYFEGAEYTLYAEQKRMLFTLAHQAATAVERAQLAEQIDSAKVHSETERFRSALLSSLSHNFETPLSAIIDAADTLQQGNTSLPTAQKDVLLETIQEEARQINRFTHNLLDITHHGGTTLQPKKEPVNLNTTFHSALGVLKRRLAKFNINLQIAGDIPPLNADPLLLEQMVVNLLENACNTSPEGSTITLSAYPDADKMVVECNDEGITTPKEAREQLFDIFSYNAESSGGRLGLAVCLGIAEAHNGTILAMEGRNGMGNRLIVRLPNN